MNRILIFIVAFISVPCFSAADDTFIEGGLSYRIRLDSTVEVMGFADDSLSSATSKEAIHSPVLNIPASVWHEGKSYKIIGIGFEAFNGCCHIHSLKLSEGLEYIYKALVGCTSLKSISIPASVTDIYKSFGACADVEMITVAPGNLIYDSRDGCNAIIESKTDCLMIGCRNTQIPPSIKTIGSGAFWGQYALTDITLPEGIEVIEYAAFRNCVNLKNINLPVTLKKIYPFAFSGASLTSVFIPKNVDYIDDGIFEGCNTLDKIVVDKDNAFYDSRRDCNAIIYTAENSLVMGCKHTVIPKDVVSITGFSFSQLTSMTRIVIPEGVNKIQPSAFYECWGLNTIEVSSKNKTYDSREHCNAIIHTASRELVVGCTNTVIPINIERIGRSAFEHRFTGYRLIIPSNIKYIGEDAFSGSRNLNYVYISEGVEKMDVGVFENCYNLDRIYLPNSLHTLPDYTFLNCYNLRRIRVGEQTKVSDKALYGCDIKERPYIGL